MPIYNSNITDELIFMNAILQYRPKNLSISKIMALGRCTKTITESEYNELVKHSNETKSSTDNQINEDIIKALDDLMRAKVQTVNKKTLLLKKHDNCNKLIREKLTSDCLLTQEKVEMSVNK